MKVAGYKAWTTDRRVHKEVDFNNLPDTGIQIIMVYYEETFEDKKHYRQAWDGCDWYHLDRGEVVGVRSKESGMEPKPATGAKSGEMTSDANFKAITALADADLSW